MLTQIYYKKLCCLEKRLSGFLRDKSGVVCVLDDAHNQRIGQSDNLIFSVEALQLLFNQH